MRLFVVFSAVVILLSSCGIFISTSSIKNAELKRETAFSRIVYVYGDPSIVDIDEFGNKSLKRDAADNVFPLDKRRAAYYFFKADAYLSKAYEFRSRSRYDDSRYLAVKAEEFFAEAAKELEGVNEKNIPLRMTPLEVEDRKPDKGAEFPFKPVSEPEPDKKADAEPEIKVAPAVKTEAKPVEKKVEKEPEKEPGQKKPSLKGDPFADKEEKKAEPQKKEEKPPSYYDVYEEMRLKYLKEKSEEDSDDKDKKQDDVPDGGAE